MVLGSRTKKNNNTNKFRVKMRRNAQYKDYKGDNIAKIWIGYALDYCVTVKSTILL